MLQVKRALGQRWALDLGGDDYNMPAYFGNKRWTYYRLKTAGQNTVSLGGSNQAAPVGAVFNAIWTFTAAGTKTFGFQEVAGVKRTYYADDATEYFWGNITNDGSVGPNSVTIN